MDAELTQLYLPILRADMTICESYKFAREVPIDTPITVFAGLKDRRLTPAQLEKWRTQTGNSFEVKTFPGNHFFWHENAEPMLKAIDRELVKICRQPVQSPQGGRLQRS